MRLMNYAIFLNLTVSDPFWVQLRQEAKTLAEREGAMSKLLQQGVLQHATFNEALANRLALMVRNLDRFFSDDLTMEGDTTHTVNSSRTLGLPQLGWSPLRQRAHYSSSQ